MYRVSASYARGESLSLSFIKLRKLCLLAGLSKNYIDSKEIYISFLCLLHAKHCKISLSDVKSLIHLML